MIVRPDVRPLITHIVYRFDVGGLENGVVNLINTTDQEKFRHSIVALTEITDFWHRLGRTDVKACALNKRPGQGIRLYPELYKLFRETQPAIVHTRNLAALEAVVPAWWAGVPVRIHGEHGWDIGDLDGSSRKYQWVRRIYRPFVTRYVALSKDLELYLRRMVGVPERKIAQVYNGVDLERFHPAEVRGRIRGCPFDDPSLWIIGTVGRMQDVKAPEVMARAFIRTLEVAPALRNKLRLVMVGDGPKRGEVQSQLAQADVESLAWLPGERDDIPTVLRGLDCFVLPSLAEGISNTILEAMATGLPVIATDVGGNGELVESGRTGELVRRGDHDALARCLVDYANDPYKARAAGRAGRERVEQRFGLNGMAHRYEEIYESMLKLRGSNVSCLAKDQ